MVSPPYGKKIADLAKSLKLPKPRTGTISKGISKKDATTHGPPGNPWKIHELIGPEDRCTSDASGVVNLAAQRMSRGKSEMMKDKASKLATHQFGHEPLDLEAIVKLFWALDGRGGDAMCCEPAEKRTRRHHFECLRVDHFRIMAGTPRSTRPHITLTILSQPGYSAGGGTMSFKHVHR
jgi:hypothetical protein